MAARVKEYRVIISKKAAQIAAFLAKASEAAAERLVAAFEIATKSLKQMPQRCPWLAGDFLPGNVYRKLIFEDRYLMIYQIRDDTVYVDCIVDCRQDYEWLIR
ncbi:MAG: type II toxin-antitoxin system RelE/ParE family toxin [Flexilinea sp.]